MRYYCMLSSFSFYLMYGGIVYTGMLLKQKKLNGSASAKNQSCQKNVFNKSERPKLK